MDPWGWWLFFVGLAVGIAGFAFVQGTVRRSDEDQAADERANEAEWITGTIAAWGGHAPSDLVTQVLDLHARYLAGDGFLAPDGPPPDESAEELVSGTAVAEPTPQPMPVASSGPAPQPSDPGRPKRARSERLVVPDAADVKRDGTGGEAAEAHVRQPG